MDIVYAIPAGLIQIGGGYSTALGHAAKLKGFLNVLGVTVPSAEAGGLMRGVTEEKAHLRSVQACGATGGGGRAEERRDAVGAPMTLRFDLLADEGPGEARTDVVAEGHSAEEMCSADSEALSDS